MGLWHWLKTIFRGKQFSRAWVIAHLNSRRVLMNDGLFQDDGVCLPGEQLPRDAKLFYSYRECSAEASRVAATHKMCTAVVECVVQRW